MTRTIEAAVFDLDGTLIDSLGDLTDALNRLLAQLGRPRLDETVVRSMVGDGAAKLVERACAATGGIPAPIEPLVSAFVGLYESAVAERTRPYPGVPEALERLSGMGIRLCVWTNKPARATRDVLAALELDRFFQAVAGGDSYTARKPDAAPLLGVLQEIGVAPAASVMVGDHLNDVACARAAGTRVIAVRFGYSSVPAEKLGADQVAGAFSEIPDLVDRLG